MNAELKLPDALPKDFKQTPASGLREQEAAERLQAGKGNKVSADAGKSTAQILFSNLFNFFNLLNFALAVALLFVGSYRNMTFLLIVLSNTLIGTFQELRARRTIRHLQLLNAPKAHVLREGQERVCSPEELVQGDLVVLRAGDQVVADALLREGNGSAMESLLTGESDAVPKQKDNWLYSGSYIVEGKMTAQLVYVGDESYVGRLTKEAKKTRRPQSMLMTELNRLIRLDSIILIPLGLLLFCKQYFLGGMALDSAVPSSVAAMLGMIPEGLILLTSVAMAVGVVKLGKKQTLVQELSGIETLARADVLCLDKTGTITSGNMKVEKWIPLEADLDGLKQAAARFLGAFDEDSGTLDALRRQLKAGTEKPVAVLPFSSKRKKSAVSFADGSTLILGAPEFVLQGKYPAEIKQKVDAFSAEGKRVTVLCCGKGCVTAEEAPAVEKVLGLCVMTDEIREGAAQTLVYFKQQGVKVKVISGDNPRTVAMIARQVELDGWQNWVDAAELDTPQKIAEACERYTVFGRVTPLQKQQLVEALKQKGHSVAMTGDGVNDIPALKTADCSIAMAGGADAARHAAQLTLLSSDFGMMPEIVLEGRRVINNITRAASLFLTKTLFSFFLSLLMLVLPGEYPFQPIQMSLVSSMMVGIPGFFLALEPSYERIQGKFLRTVLLRALPGGLAVALCATLAMLLRHAGWESTLCSTLATLLAGYVSYLVLVRTCVPLSKLRGVVLLVVAAGFCAAVALFGKFFYLVPLEGQAWLALGILAALGTGIVFLADGIIRLKNKKKAALDR